MPRADSAVAAGPGRRRPAAPGPAGGSGGLGGAPCGVLDGPVVQPVQRPGTRMSSMTGPADAFVAPDDALRDFDEAGDLTADKDEGPTAPPADAADPPGAVGPEAAPG